MNPTDHAAKRAKLVQEIAEIDAVLSEPEPFAFIDRNGSERAVEYRDNDEFWLGHTSTVSAARMASCAVHEKLADSLAKSLDEYRTRVKAHRATAAKRAELQAQLAAFDATPEPQEPKYDFRDGRVVNKASGETIPVDEPVFVFRARDRRALATLRFYADHVADDNHRSAIEQRINSFRRFSESHPTRMKEPDTDTVASIAVPVYEHPPAVTPRAPQKVERWMNVFSDGSAEYFDDLDSAQREAAYTQKRGNFSYSEIAVPLVRGDVTEGGR